MPDILFCGYFGFGNLGDEALLQAITGAIARERPELRLAALVGPSGSDLPECVEQISRRDIPGVRRALATSSLLCVGPGGVFQDVTSPRSCAWYAWMTWRARRTGARIAHIGQSVGPLSTRLGRAAAASAFRGSEIIAVRDDPSVPIAAILSGGVRVERTSDVAWLLPIEPSGARDEALIALAPRPWAHGRVTTAWWAEVVDALRATGREALGVAMSDDDLRLLHEVGRLSARKTESVRCRSVEEAAEAFGRCGALIGMRLHSLILGVLAGCRVAGVSYDPKVSGALDAVGLEPAVRVEEPPAPRQLAADLDALARSADPEAVGHERRRAARNAEILCALASGSESELGPR